MTLPSKYKGKGSYGDLTEAEAATWNEYTNLRQISDWPGFDANQDQRRADSRQWILDRIEYIDACANGEVAGMAPGWEVASRGKRSDFLSGLNSGAPKHEVRLPCPGTATDAEKVYIEEREVYLVFASAYDKQRQRKLANVNWLVEQRKKLWRLMRDDPAGNKPNDRDARYEALCIATHYGQAYKRWDKAHNKWGQPYTTDSTPSTGRDGAMVWCRSYLGTSEKPPGSNKGQPQPSQWQKRIYGSDGVPWCACFAGCSALDNGVSGLVTAGVWNNTQLAKQGRGMYRGFTTDPSKVRRGDHFFIGNAHQGVVRSDTCSNSRVPTYEGNTSPGAEGSQYNGGTVAEKTRSTAAVGGSITGFGLVRFND